ncbi:MAG: SIMPL domain-containing protein [Bacteroidota bacterium]
MKKSLSALIFSAAIVIAAFALGNGISKRYTSKKTISVTGLGSENFTSDLIVWEGSFSVENLNLKQAYQGLENSKTIIKSYLIQKGVKDNELVFKAVTNNRITKAKYSNDGKYIGDEFLGYSLTQSLEVNSNDVDTIESISREVTELLNEGIRFYSVPPRYYYTKIEDLKIEMISKATANAFTRAQKIAENSGSQLGNLVSGNMGVFQITGQNSSEDYSWGGTFNTSSKEKTARITMKLIYELK